MENVEQQKVRGKYFKKSLKAKEVLRLYEVGERNFQGVILRGQSFKGQDLSEADFSDADIRSTDFTNAILSEAIFTGAKCGLQKRWFALLTFLSLFLSAVSGFLSIALAIAITSTFGNNSSYQSIGRTSVMVLLCFLIPAIQKGIKFGLFVIVSFGSFLSVLASFAIILLANTSAILIDPASILIQLALTQLATLAAIAGIVAAIGAGLIAVTVAMAKAVAGRWVSLAATVLATITGIGAANLAVAVEAASISAISIAAAGGYIGWRALKGDKRDSWIHSLSSDFAAMGGTSFYYANLTKANFIGARLKGTNFRKTNITCVRWFRAKMLDLVLPGDTYLKNTQLQRWLIGNGTNNNFDGQNLHGVNLQRADLTNASFINTNLTGADFCKTTLTGACIQDWNINNKTQFDDVTCDYIYLEQGNQERIPHDPDRIFKPGEFAKYIEKALNTVDLIFTDGIDWKAFFASFQALQDEYGAENLGVQAIERKTGDTFVVRIEVPPDANKAEIESHSKQLYESNLKALEDKYRTELQAKDREIELYKEKSADMKEIAKLLASRPISVEAKAVAENQLKNVEVEMNFQAPVTGAAGKVSGDMNVYASEQKQTLTEVTTEIVKLLDYFKQNDPSITQARQIVKTATENQPEILDAEIVEEAINSSPTLKQRLGAAGTAAYIETVKMLLPPLGIAIEAVKAYRNPELG